MIFESNVLTYNTMKNYLLIIINSIFLIGCEKSQYPLMRIDPKYPTTIIKPDPTQLTILRDDFITSNIYLESSLDEYGFCGYGDDLVNAQIPPAGTLETSSEAIKVAKTFIIENSKYTGVNDTAKLQFSEIERFHDSWRLTAYTQKIDTIEVKTYLSIHIKNKEVHLCFGNWYSDIYIPKSINVGPNSAKNILLGKVVTHVFNEGPQDVRITMNDINSSEITMYVLPLKKDNQIELRLVWSITMTDPVNYIMFVDAMTGEIVEKRPTVIINK